MINDTDELTELVNELIHTGREDDWWDFKQCHYEDRGDWLLDILCLANNRANRDSYLIIGVEDKTFKVLGVENDPHRRNQQNTVDFLLLPMFAGQVRPRVEVRTVKIKEHEIDVFIIKNSTDVPYYLIEDYTDKKFKPEPPRKGKTVRAFHIYTRVMDTNTPVDNNADIRDIEYLWKKRFGLLQTPLEQIKVFLRNPKDWAEEDGRYFHKLFPQYTITVEPEEMDDGLFNRRVPMFYHYIQTNSSASYGKIRIRHYNTQLFSCQSTDLDGHRMIAPCPESKSITYRDYEKPSTCLRYYTIDSLQYLLLRFLEFHIGESNGNEAQIATKRLLEAVSVFESKTAVDDFSAYIYDHLDDFDKTVALQENHPIENESEKAAEAMNKEIKISKAFKAMQKEWETTINR